MEIRKSLQLCKSPNVEDDIGLINEHSIKELRPEEVFVFSVILCDNNVDRDFEAFEDTSLMSIAELFVGKTGIFNHSWDSKDQISRIYKTEVESTGGTNTFGDPEKRVVALAYMLREYNEEVISKIEGGILKEVSIGLSIESCECSICGKKMWLRSCEDGHRKGSTHDGKLCYGILKTPTDAYEFSFVAVPAQRSAGVTKDFEDTNKAIEMILSVDLSDYPKEAQKIIDHCKIALMKSDEQARRLELGNINKKFLEEKNKNELIPDQI